MANIHSMVNLNEIDENATRLSRARTVKVAKIVEEEGKNVARIIDNRFGIENIRTGEVVDFCSERYAILQHSDAVGMVTSSLRSFGIEARGNLLNYGNNIAVEILFDNVVMPSMEVSQSMTIPDGANGIQLGIRFVNSFNKSTGFRGFGFGWRLACKNGMYLKTVLPEITFSVKHTGDVQKRVAVQIKDAILKLIKERGAVIAIVEEARKDIVNFADQKEMVATVASYVGSARQANYILETTGSHLGHDVSRWDLYNALTDYATHAQLSYPMQDRIARGAENMLVKQVVIVDVNDDEVEMEVIE